MWLLNHRSVNTLKNLTFECKYRCDSEVEGLLQGPAGADRAKERAKTECVSTTGYRHRDIHLPLTRAFNPLAMTQYVWYHCNTGLGTVGVYRYFSLIPEYWMNEFSECLYTKVMALVETENISDDPMWKKKDSSTVFAKCFFNNFSSPSFWSTQHT